MIRLHRTDTKLQAFLAGAPATTNPTVTVFYKDDTPQETLQGGTLSKGNVQFTVLAAGTETDICAAPGQGAVREIDALTVFNADTASVIVTVCIDDNGTNRILIKRTLTTLQSLHYEHSSGWQIIATS